MKEELLLALPPRRPHRGQDRRDHRRGALANRLACLVLGIPAPAFEAVALSEEELGG